MIQRYSEEIDDCKYWTGKDATLKIIGCVRRLKALGVKRIPLSNCYLAGVNFTLHGLEDALAGTTLFESDLTDATLIRVDLSDTYCVGTRFCGANLTKANLSNADLTRADLRGAILKGELWWPAQGGGVGKTLYYANMKGAKLDNATALSHQRDDLKAAGADLSKIKFSDRS